ncbi:hypothetical protein B9G55_04865 [Saccharibacillus sp. O16]|nr:hypothetical protein B9G55_04865 [Saccharibacillus sp. O16]
MDRRVRKTRETLFETLIEMLRQKDLERITVQEIADHADVHRGTVYLHFQDKFDLLNQCMDSYLQRLNDSCRPDDPSEPIEDALLRTFRYLEDSADVYGVLFRSDGLSAFRSRLSDMLREGAEAQFDRCVLDPRVNKEITVQFVTTAIAGLLEWWISRSMPYSSEEMVEQLVLLLQANGLRQAGQGTHATNPGTARSV